MTSRVPAAVASVVGRRGSIVIRLARPDDGPALDRLQALADRRLPAAPLLVAEADGELLAAAPTSGGDVVTDPFRVTLDIVELLRLRSSQLRAAA
jgi:hypothetical protein